eukprot:snap_masked-scaffold_3-processed-gene-9.31-mRNA-1 protein AED:1.00 eAED:1.00 QI:0/0/0/0/1/1/2/0/256
MNTPISKKNTGFRHSVLEIDKIEKHDKAAPSKVQGHLMKLSGKGKWQSRFFSFNNGYLNYYINEESKITNHPPLGALDLRHLSECRLESRFGVLVLDFNGFKYRLKAKNLDETKVWIDEINFRAKHCSTQNKKFFLKKFQDFPRDTCEPMSGQDSKETAIENSVENVDSRDGLSMAGFLNLGTESRFYPWRRKYFHLVNTLLLGYNEKEDLKDKTGDFVFQFVLNEESKMKSLTVGDEKGFVLENSFAKKRFLCKW